VILVDGGTYTGTISLAASAAGVLIVGAPNAPVTLSGAVTAGAGTGPILDNLSLTGGLTLTGTTDLVLEDSTVAGSGISVSGGAGDRFVHDAITTPGVGISVAGGADSIAIENDVITAGTAGVTVTGAGATNL